MRYYVTDFQIFAKLEPANGIADRKTIMSLMISTGDPSRQTKDCDCATQLDFRKAKELNNAGYKCVGRYLTGYVGSGEKRKAKNLTVDELREVANAGLKVFPIYQDGGFTKEYFTKEQGYIDARKAIETANNLFIPRRSIIYFAVDYDFMDSQVTSKVIPYFQSIDEVIRSKSNPNNYVAGVYGSRNICTRVS
ncbi:MAG: DUF1906 domain-containing protein [Firmicutes bacterium]|nr:DUF1906 domain-containing protein [Bacillota bacterium]